MKTHKWIVGAVLGALVMMLAACGSATPTPAPAPAQSPAPTGAAARALLVAALKGQMAQPAWRMTVNTDDAGVKTVNKIEVVAPDRFHVVAPDGGEMIAIKGVGTFEKGRGAAWARSPQDMSDMLTMLLDPQQADGLLADSALENLQYVGAEQAGGKTQWTYQYQAINKAGNWPVTITTKIWIGAADKLPYREETQGDSGTVRGGKLKQTSVYEYDPNLKIAAPIP